MAGGSNGKTPRITVPQRMLNLLSDGRPHTIQELHGCLEDELGELSNVWAHLTALRRALATRGEDVVCRRRDGVSWYCLVRSIRIE